MPPAGGWGHRRTPVLLPAAAALSYPDGRIIHIIEIRKEVDEMSRNEKLVLLGAAVVGAAALHKVADKEARELHIPLALVGVAIWALS